MRVAQKPAVIYVAHNVFDGFKGEAGLRSVVHRKDHARDNLGGKHEGKDAAKGPPIVEIARVREGHERRVKQPPYRKPAFEPFGEAALWGVGRLCAHRPRSPRSFMSMILLQTPGARSGCTLCVIRSLSSCRSRMCTEADKGCWAPGQTGSGRSSHKPTHGRGKNIRL